jgi:hypothetical protein
MMITTATTDTPTANAATPSTATNTQRGSGSLPPMTIASLQRNQQIRLFITVIRRK